MHAERHCSSASSTLRSISGRPRAELLLEVDREQPLGYHALSGSTPSTKQTERISSTATCLGTELLSPIV